MEMGAAVPAATFLLPAADRLGGQRLGADAARALGRGDRLPRRAPGRREQLLRHFSLLPGRWPMAALTRQLDAGDAAGSLWLRADPAYVRPDINGARLLAIGEALALDAGEAAAFTAALRPLFGDAGMPIDAPVPSRWYLRLPPGASPPAFSAPDVVLGADLFDHLAEGHEGRRWRMLLGEAQVVLHNHPLNERRAAQGRPPVNSLWFWGAGVLPDAVRSPLAAACSDAEDARALAAAAGIARPLAARFEACDGDVLFDLHTRRDLQALERDWLLPALQALARGRLRRVLLDLADGDAFELRRAQRWRLWRKPLQWLDA